MVVSSSHARKRISRSTAFSDVLTGTNSWVELSHIVCHEVSDNKPFVPSSARLSPPNVHSIPTKMARRAQKDDFRELEIAVSP